VKKVSAISSIMRYTKKYTIPTMKGGIDHIEKRRKSLYLNKKNSDKNEKIGVAVKN